MPPVSRDDVPSYGRSRPSRPAADRAGRGSTGTGSGPAARPGASPGRSPASEGPTTPGSRQGPAAPRHAPGQVGEPRVWPSPDPGPQPERRASWFRAGVVLAALAAIGLVSGLALPLLGGDGIAPVHEPAATATAASTSISSAPTATPQRGLPPSGSAASGGTASHLGKDAKERLRTVPPPGLDGVAVRLKPAQMVAAPGERLVCSVWVDPGDRRIAAVDLSLEFDPDVLALAKARQGPFLGENPMLGRARVTSTGYTLVAARRGPSPSPGSPEKLLAVTFRVRDTAEAGGSRVAITAVDIVAGDFLPVEAIWTSPPALVTVKPAGQSARQQGRPAANARFRLPHG